MPITKTRRNFRRAFTLIELLVVIGIIVLLISILLPTIGRVRQAAYAADTQSEIVTISTAIHNYYLDNNAFPGPFSNRDIELGHISGLTGPGGTPSFSGTV